MSEENPTQVVDVIRSDADATKSSKSVFDLLDRDFLDQIEGIADLGGDRVHAALWAAKTHLPAIAKDGQLTFGSNTVAFTRVEDIRKALYPQFAKFGLMAYYRIVASDEVLQVASEPWTQAQAVNPETGVVDRNGVIQGTGRPIYDNRIPKTRMWAWVEYVVDFVFILDGSKVTVGPFKGSAYDTDSDKATGKATTAAIKRLLSETFDVVDEKESELDETGEDTKNRPDTTDQRQVKEGDNRGAQNLAAAAAGSSGRPGRPPRGRQKAQAAATPAPEAPAAPAAEPTPPAPAPAAETPAPAAEAPAPAAPEAVQPSDEAVASADASTGEVPEEKVVAPDAPPAPPAAPISDGLAEAKARLKDANVAFGLGRDEIDALATEVTGFATRAEWITKSTAINKIAEALEKRTAGNA